PTTTHQTLPEQPPIKPGFPATITTDPIPASEANHPSIVSITSMGRTPKLVRVSSSTAPIDVALIGGGIMSATLGAIIKQLQPDWSIEIFETLSDVALESSNPWNNAGTGHAALCELNYTKEQPDGTFDISSAVTVNEQFQLSRQFWSYLVGAGLLPEPQNFINPVPHMSFVWGDENVDYLRRRYDALKDHPLFAGLEFSDD